MQEGRRRFRLPVPQPWRARSEFCEFRGHLGQRLKKG
jgi:hypothetical protein